jgi:hypothetical protein
MPAKRSRGRGEDLVVREVAISSFRAHVSLGIAQKPKPPQIKTNPWLALAGKMDEALRNIRDAIVRVHVDESREPGPARPASVGAIVQVRPEITAVVGLPQSEFDRVWTFVISGQLKYVRLVFTTPRHGTALIVAASFSNLPDE